MVDITGDRLEMPEDLTRLVRLLINLGHLNYALRGMKHEDIQEASDQPPLGLFTEVAFQRLADWFSKPNGKVAQIEKALANLDLPSSWLHAIDEVLDGPIGATTWRQLNKDYRNEAISHKTFEAEIFTLIFGKNQVDPRTWGESFEAFMEAIVPLVLNLQSNVQAVVLSRYPEFYKGLVRTRAFYMVD